MRYQPPHLRARIASGKADQVIAGVKIVHQPPPIAVQHPRIHLPRIETERYGRSQSKRLISAIEVIGRRVGHFHGAALHRIEHPERWHKLARAMHLDLKPPPRQGLDGFGKHPGATVNGVQRRGKARNQAPAHSGLGMHSRGQARRQHRCDAGMANG